MGRPAAGKRRALPCRSARAPTSSVSHRKTDPATSSQCGRDFLIERTLEVWQPRADRRLDAEDAREIAENICGFFNVLVTWATAEPRRSIIDAAGAGDE